MLLSDQTSVWAHDESKMEAPSVTEMEMTTSEPQLPEAPTPTDNKALRHVFLTKTVRLLTLDDLEKKKYYVFVSSA